MLTVASAQERLAHLVDSRSSKDFVRRINEVLERYWAMGTFWGGLEVRTITSETDPNGGDFNVIELGEREALLGLQLVESGRPIPLWNQFSEFNPLSGGRTVSYVDMGLVRVTPGTDYDAHLYRVPEADKQYWALVKKAPATVLNDTDEIPIRNIGALKMGILASIYEDNNDMQNASIYWGSGKKILDDELAMMRGSNLHPVPIAPEGVGFEPTPQLY